MMLFNIDSTLCLRAGMSPPVREFSGCSMERISTGGGFLLDTINDLERSQLESKPCRPSQLSHVFSKSD